MGAQALVGSSNFTRPGLTRNIELNVQIQSAREVAQLQKWFETHWAEAREVTEVVIETISRHTHLYSPFDVYGKALQQFFRGHELTATEWDDVEGTRQDKIVVVQLRDVTDPETGQRYTVKRYKSEEAKKGDSWNQQKITLEVVNPDFVPIVITGADEREFQVVAELVEALEG